MLYSQSRRDRHILCKKDDKNDRLCLDYKILQGTQGDICFHVGLSMKNRLCSSGDCSLCSSYKWNGTLCTI